MEQKTVNVKYTESKDYKIFHATGAFGGVSPIGDIIAHFYIDVLKPSETVQLVIEDGGNAKEKPQPSNFVRELQVAIAVRPDIAYVIGNWLIEKAKEAGFKIVQKS
jgi:hypothetical protein